MGQTDWRNNIGELKGSQTKDSQINDKTNEINNENPKPKKNKTLKVIVVILILSVIILGGVFIYNQKFFDFSKNETTPPIITQSNQNFSSWILEGIEKGYAQNLSSNIERYIATESLKCKILPLMYNNTHQTNLVNLGCLKLEWQNEIYNSISQQQNPQLNQPQSLL